MKLLALTVKTIFIAGLMAPELLGQVTQIVGNRGIRECASCHVEWIESFAQPATILLMEKPAKPMRAESQTCLSCHDGSVVDSRRRVWLEHGHQTDLVPPPGMKIPDVLPLEDGKIVCRTCHTAHISQNPVNLDNPVFLRVINDKGQLCMLCHPDNIPQKNSHITHPLGDMAEPIPAELIEAGARALPDENQVHCQVCHTPHGSKQDHLLVMGANNNNLCLTCHSEKRPGMWHEKQKIPHPDRPIIHSEVQQKAIDNMGTRHGEENRLICLSCHRMHDGKSGKFMLAMPLEDSSFCIQCHPDQVDLMKTRHNPRIFAYGIENLEGVTIDQAGPCSACHMFHSIAQPPSPSEYDPQGICISCHSAGGLAGRTGALRGQLANTHPLNVPVPNMLPDQALPLFENYHDPRGDLIMTCQTCHNLHGTNHQPGFLRISPEKLCQTCHGALTEKMTGNPHDPQSFGGHWPVNIDVDQSCSSCHRRIHTWDSSRHMNQCSLCHRMHSWDDNQSLWTFTPPSTESYTSENICITCHNDIRWAYAESRPPIKSVIHPRDITTKNGGNLPTLSLESDQQQLICQTCHDPHTTPDVPYLLNIPAGAPAVELCYECHDNMRSLERSMHNPKNLNQNPNDPPCTPCHHIHATQDSSNELFRLAPPGDLNKTPTEKLCLNCHQNSDSKNKITFIDHPEPLLMTGALQLWASYQSFSVPGDRISCITCHLPHGRDFNPPASSNLPTPAPLPQISALKPLLRPLVDQNLCAQCHDADAPKLFLYYHYPEKRK